MEKSLAMLERHNVIGIASGPLRYVERWREAAPERIIPGILFRLGPDEPTPEQLKNWHDDGRIAVLGEVTIQYQGITPDDTQFEPYLAMAAANDLPVGIHIGTGPPGAPHLGFSAYRARMHSPLSLEEPLMKHQGMRVYVMHAGYPMLDDMLALMWAHPQVYVEVGVIAQVLPRDGFHRYLKAIVDAGHGNRVMFGSDQMVWPDMIEVGIEVIESADYLSASQKRDIFYNNAARFFRFTDEQIAAHHAR